MLTLDIPVVVGVFEGTESISASKTTISSTQNYDFNRLPDQIQKKIKNLEHLC
jgi:hypothetical protein